MRNGDSTPLYFRILIPLLRPFPNFDFSFIKPVRRRAAQLLRLQPGSHVLDVGCGPGGSFPYLVEAVGASGRVVGLEISPEVAVNARRRVDKNSWTNVEVVVGDARSVQLQGRFDGMLAFAAADTYASPEALANLVPRLKDGARLVAFGAKLSRRHPGKPFNLLFRLLWNLTFSSTPRISYEPMAPMRAYVDDLQTEEYFFGCMFLAWGSLKAARPTA